MGAASMGPADAQQGPPQFSQMLYMMRLPQAPALGDDPQTTTNAWTNTWQRPTLTNPCPEAARTRCSPGPWPKSSRDCAPVDGVAAPNGLRNAWDDIFNARVTYETRFAAKTRPDQPRADRRRAPALRRQRHHP